jgi:hypothetical protein
METIKCSPILVCRTKYIDYPTGKPFCCPEDLSLKNFELLVSMMSNGDNLSPTIRSCRIFINDGTHCIIGKYGKLSVFLNDTDESIDLSLDKPTGGREPWGFIGAVIKTNDFIFFGKVFDLSDNYYATAYKKYLYNEHWLEQQFTGTYHYPYVEETVKLIDVENTDTINSQNAYIIETDDKNSLLFAFSVESALKGERISFCTNAEYNASRLISQNHVDIVTVSTKKLDMHKAELQKPQKEMQKEIVVENDNKKESEYSYKEKKTEREEYSNKQQRDIHYRKIPLFNLYLGYEKIENNKSIFEFIIGNHRCFLTKQLPTEESRINSKTSFKTNKSSFNNKNYSNLDKDKYKF